MAGRYYGPEVIVYAMRLIDVVGQVFGPRSEGNEPVRGCYLREYDPEGFCGMGAVDWTTDIAEAKHFETAREALKLYHAVPESRPRRFDGQPNKPLRAFTVEIVNVDKVAAQGV